MPLKLRQTAEQKKKLNDQATGDSVGYAWYLSIWMRVFHGSEEQFWKRMNPRRMGQLLATLEKPREPEKRIQSLSQFMAGGE